MRKSTPAFRFSDEGYSDDEDTSWKVRRAAARALSAVVTENPGSLQDIYAQASQALTSRFREREENVKVDVFNTLVDLVRQVQIPLDRIPTPTFSLSTA